MNAFVHKAGRDLNVSWMLTSAMEDPALMPIHVRIWSVIICATAS